MPGAQYLVRSTLIARCLLWSRSGHIARVRGTSTCQRHNLLSGAHSYPGPWATGPWSHSLVRDEQYSGQGHTYESGAHPWARAQRDRDARWSGAHLPVRDDHTGKGHTHSQGHALRVRGTPNDQGHTLVSGTITYQGHTGQWYLYEECRAHLWVRDNPQERAHFSQDQGAQKLVRGTPRRVDSYTFGRARALPIMSWALPMVTWALPKFDPSETFGNANDT